ncbi:MAG TPA: cytochrome c oxidase subunit 3 [Thermoleophilaceae bacterium]|jgi:cytochrome c oxidase subunit 3/cytochrome c oxidase subunit I+III|nr:cytochrome c oxidase subunit 3 [Thermoleophilaceae bacterium]
MSEVMRSQEATTPAMAAAAQRQRRALPNGWWGVALFIGGETTFFGLMISSYFYLRFQNAHWPPVGVEKPKVALPLILTAILVASVVPLIAAVRAGLAGRVARAWVLLLVAFVVQGGYLGVQIHEFLSDLDKMSPHATAYSSIYFTMLGAHHLHVAAGLLLELWLLGKLLGGLTNYRLIALRVTALYGYFVAVVGIAVVFTEIYPSL